MCSNGEQIVLANKFCQNRKFYEMIEVEGTVRHNAPEMEKVYFILLFACCRELYNPEKNFGVGIFNKFIRAKTHRIRFNSSASVHIKEDNVANDCTFLHSKATKNISNFTMMFGCDP